MSNISQASKNIKKKLSFDDYSKPAHQQADATGNMFNGMTTASVTKQNMVTVPKIKATFYLTEEDNQALTDMFIKRLQEKNKTDKSALVAQAINLLYKQEMQ